MGMASTGPYCDVERVVVMFVFYIYCSCGIVCGERESQMRDCGGFGKMTLSPWRITSSTQIGSRAIMRLHMACTFCSIFWELDCRFIEMPSICV